MKNKLKWILFRWSCKWLFPDGISMKSELIGINSIDDNNPYRLVLKVFKSKKIEWLEKILIQGEKEAERQK